MSAAGRTARSAFDTPARSTYRLASRSDEVGRRRSSTPRQRSWSRQADRAPPAVAGSHARHERWPGRAGRGSGGMTKQGQIGAGAPAGRSGAAATGRGQERSARLPAQRDAARRVGGRRLRHGRRDPGRGDRAAGRGGRGRSGDGRHPARLDGRAGDGRSGAVRLDTEVQPSPPHRRVPDLHRPRQHHPALPRRELGAVGRPQDLDLPACARA